MSEDFGSVWARGFSLTRWQRPRTAHLPCYLETFKARVLKFSKRLGFYRVATASNPRPSVSTC
jgi:hypothetical protein